MCPRCSVGDGTSGWSGTEETQGDSDTRIENVEEFISAAHGYAEGAEDKSMRAFLEEIALVADVDSLDTENGMLTLMTLHNAKGLEFDVVFIAGVEEGLLPHGGVGTDAQGRAPDVEEERRLLYVGMTRARERLTLSYAGRRWQQGVTDQWYALCARALLCSRRTRPSPPPRPDRGKRRSAP